MDNQFQRLRQGRTKFRSLAEVIRHYLGNPR